MPKTGKMKNIFLIFGIVILASCKTGENAVEDVIDVTDTPEETVIDTRVLGTVHVSDTGCPVYIEAVTETGKLKMYPVNLEDKFKVEGLRLKFNYNPVKVSQPEGCITDITVEVVDPAAIRR